MMKRKLLLLTLALLLLSTLLVACSGDKEIIGIQLVKEGFPYEVTVGTTPDYSNVKANIQYNDETTKEVTGAELTFGTIDTSKVGSQELTITYEGFSITVTITVKAPQVTLSKIEIISSSVADDVLVGGTHDTTGLQVLATYSDNTTKTLSAADVTINGIDTTTAGDKTLTVTYGGKTATMTITVAGVSGIRAEGVPATVEEGTELDLSALKVYAVYSNGAEILLESSAYTYTVTDVTVEEAAAKKLTVIYGSFTKDIVVSSIPPTLESIEIVATSYLKKIVIGETYPTADITATAHYSNGTTGTIATADLTITAPNTATAGAATLKIAYEGKEATATVTVLGITSVQIQANTVNGNKHTVIVGDTVDLSAVAATVTYSDNSTNVITAANGLQVGTVSTATPGTVTLTVTYKGVNGTLNLTVEEAYSVDSSELSAELAAFLGKNFSNNYQDRDATYKVGDDNPFRFTLTLSVWDNKMDAPGSDITDYVSKSKVYLVTEDGEQLLEDADIATYVVINEQDNTFDFTDAAVGKRFRIETRPAFGVDESDADTVAAVTKSIPVEVVDGYNVYSAKELNIITNGNSKDLSQYGQTTKTQLQLVDEFLQNNNITRPTNLRGIVLHGNLTVTTNDIPEGYLYSYTNSKGLAVKELYDHFSVFFHELDGANKDFTLYGNYFQINTAKLPCVAEAGHAGNVVEDPSSSSEVFKFSVKETEYNNVVEGQQLGLGLAYDHTKYHTRVENLFMMGDDPNVNDESQTEKAMRGLIAFKTHLQVVDFYNVLVEKHIVSLIPSGDNLDVTIDKCYFFNAWSTHIFVWNTNRIMSDLGMRDNYPTEMAHYKPMTVTIKNSTIAKCGGPVIASQIPDADYNRNSQSGATITADNCVMYSEIQGNEAWFNAYNFTTLATQLKALNQPISLTATGYGTTASFIKDTTMGGSRGEFVNLIFVNQGPRGSFTMTNTNTTTINPQEQTAAAYIAATGGQAPIFQSSAGGIGYFNGSAIATLPSGNPAPQLFQGDYLNIYYQGMSIMVGYYH